AMPVVPPAAMITRASPATTTESRRPVMLLLRCVLLPAVLGLGAVPAAAPGKGGPGWEAGAAKAGITPEQFPWVSGDGARTKPAEGKIHDLWAKALAFEDPSGRRAVLVTMDLVGIDRELSASVCRELMKKHGLPREAIVLSTSHTHSGPVVRGNLMTMYPLDETQQKHVADYAVTLRDSLARVADKALAELHPPRPHW